MLHSSNITYNDKGRRGEKGNMGLGHITQEAEDHHSEMKLKLQSITKHSLTKLNNGVGNSLE